MLHPLVLDSGYQFFLNTTLINVPSIRHPDLSGTDSDFCYLSHIDGLRAIAVTLVILFHAGFGFSGGFVGVDVFFVISGFLITGLILRDLQQDRLSLSQFWLRRIRRILPAALTATVLTLIAGSIILLPNDFSALGESIVPQQLMLANVFFWRESGYFATEAELKPLLHFWSLAVEEQFYLVYPLFLMFAFKRLDRKGLNAVLVIATVSSLALSEWGVRNKPGATFFLLPTRAWEMLLGGLIWQLPSLTCHYNRTRQVLSFAALAAILSSGLLYSKFTAFPGVAALLPCSATALLIYCNRTQDTLVSSLLSKPLFTLIGQLSYSLYLFHWPVLVLMRHTPGVDPTSSLSRTVALILIIVLAYLSWRFVERPIRHRQIFPNQKRFVLSVFAASLSLIATGGTIWALNGIPARIDPTALRYAAARSSIAFADEVELENVTNLSLPTFGVDQSLNRCLIWGDSHAKTLVSGLHVSCLKHQIKGYQATHSTTPPLVDFVWQSEYGLREESPAFARGVVELVESEHIQMVILASMWAVYQNDPSFESCLRKTVLELNRRGTRVIIVRDVATHGGNIPLMLSRAVRIGRDISRIGTTSEQYARHNAAFDGVVKRLDPSSVTILDPRSALVDTHGFWRAELDGVVLYRDSNHLTIEGSHRLIPVFDELLHDVFETPIDSKPQGPNH